MLENEKFTAERTALIAKLRKKTRHHHYDVNSRKNQASFRPQLR